MRHVLPLICCALLCACAAPVGQYNSDTGLTGHPVPVGSLAGTWGHSTFFSTIVPIPVLGDRPGGGGATRLVHRVWDPDKQVYVDTFIRCTNEVLPVEGTNTIVRPQTLAKMAPTTHEVVVDHDLGIFLSGNVIDLWGVKDLPDPLTTPLPTPDNYEKSPQSDWMWDEDEDGNPGVTIFMRGTLTADLYVVKRNVYVFDGTIVSDDRIQGLNKTSVSESNSVKSTVGWLAGTGTAKSDPDPLKSWFDMVRLKDDATCDDVAQAVADGKLAVSERPF